MEAIRISRALAVLTLAAPARATTWIVDDGGGAGVDFTDLPPAVATAAPGDSIVVLPGYYSGFTLSTPGVTVVGPGVLEPVLGTALIQSEVRFEHVPPGRKVVFSGFYLHALSVLDCAAPVLLDDLDASLVAWRIEGSADVRLTRVSFYGDAPQAALEVVASRVEITRSDIDGGAGDYGGFGTGGVGGIGIRCTQGADVHVSASSVSGGTGGDAACDFGVGGDGNYAILASDPGTRLSLSGVESDWIFGGCGGFGCPQDGLDLPALRIEQGASARVSGVRLLTCLAPPISTATGGTVDQVSPADPSLATAGSQAPGGTLTFVVRGPVGASARIRLGRAPDVVAVPPSYEDRLLQPLRTFSLGAIPPSGEVLFPIALSAGLPPGTLIMAQGSTTTAAGTELTQSVPLIVR